MPVPAATVVSHLAAAQRGVVTTAQARQQGVSRVQLARLAEKGLLERLGQGVYAMASAAGDEHLELRAAWLSLEPALSAERRLGAPSTGVVSHASAAGLHRLGDLLDDEHDVTFPGRRQTRREGVRLHRAPLDEEDVTLVEGLPVTTPARTVVDLLRADTDLSLVAEMVADGLSRGIVDEADLAARLDPLARRRGEVDGRSLLEAMLGLVGMSPAALAGAIARTDVGARIAADVAERMRVEITRALGGPVDLARLGVSTPALDLRGVTPPPLDPAVSSRLQQVLRTATAAASSGAASSVDWSRVGQPSLQLIRQVADMASRSSTSAAAAAAEAESPTEQSGPPDEPAAAPTSGPPS